MTTTPSVEFYQVDCGSYTTADQRFLVQRPLNKRGTGMSKSRWTVIDFTVRGSASVPTLSAAEGWISERLRAE